MKSHSFSTRNRPLPPPLYHRDYTTSHQNETYPNLPPQNPHNLPATWKKAKNNAQCATVYMNHRAHSRSFCDLPRLQRLQPETSSFSSLFLLISAAPSLAFWHIGDLVYMRTNVFLNLKQPPRKTNLHISHVLFVTAVWDDVRRGSVPLAARLARCSAC
jgi:hypothetical protein